MKKKNVIKGISLVVLLSAGMALTGCTSDAQTVSDNLSTKADQFGVERQIVVQSTITNQYILEVTGRCSVLPTGKQLPIICEIGKGKYIKDIVGVSDNTTWSVQQITAQGVSKYHYEYIFKPTSILPTIDVETQGK